MLAVRAGPGGVHTRDHRPARAPGRADASRLKVGLVGAKRVGHLFQGAFSDTRPAVEGGGVEGGGEALRVGCVRQTVVAHGHGGSSHVGNEAL